MINSAEDDDLAVAEAQAEAKAKTEAEAQARARILAIEVVPLMLYLLLVGLLTAVVWLSRTRSYDYFFARMVRANVLESEMDTTDTEVASVFADVTSLEGVYQFLRGPLLAALYVETSVAGRPLPPSGLRRVNEENVLVGTVRLQQVRVSPGGADACSIPETFASSASAVPIRECYPSWSAGVSAHDTSAIIGTDPSSSPQARPECAKGGAAFGTSLCAPTAYRWSDVAASGAGSFTGVHASYDGSGYVEHLPTGLASARAKLRRLEADGWLGPRTRAVWVTFTLYSPSINRFCVSRLLFERLASGALAPSSSIHPVNLTWYDGDGIPLQLIAEGLLLLLVLVFIGLELRAMYTRGLRDYWLDPSNWYDWPSLLGFALMAFLRYKTWAAMQPIRRQIAADAADGKVDAAINFHEVAFWAENEQLVIAVDTLLVYLKVLHFLAGVPHISTLLHTLIRARDRLLSFTACLGVLVFAFSAAFYLLLGTQLRAWSGLGQSALSLLHFVLGDVDVVAIFTASPALGTLLYLLFYFLVVTVSINIFLAIVTDAYAAERASAIRVDLPKVLREAWRRQYGKSLETRRQLSLAVTWPVRALRRAGRALKRVVLRRKMESAAADDAADANADASADASAAESAPADEGSVPKLTEAERGAAALAAMAAAKEALEGGHVFVLNEVSTRLKSLCFRQDTRAHSMTALREPLNAVLAELERLAGINDKLKTRARDAGWQWDLAAGELMVRGNGDVTDSEDEMEGGGSFGAFARALQQGDAAGAEPGEQEAALRRRRKQLALQRQLHQNHADQRRKT